MVEHVNDNSPVLFLDFPIGRNLAATFTEGDTRVPVTGDVLIVDADYVMSTVYQIEVQVTSGCVSTEDVLEFMDPQPTTLNATYSSGTCSLTLEGGSSDLQSDFSHLRYRNSRIDDPSELDRVITFTITDGLLPFTKSFTSLSIIAVNDAPFVDLDVGNPQSSDSMVTFILGSGSVPIVDTSAICALIAVSFHTTQDFSQQVALLHAFLSPHSQTACSVPSTTLHAYRIDCLLQENTNASGL